jgi:hypothetical protein
MININLFVQKLTRSKKSMNQNAPSPMPFAIMRNAHEAMRASIRLQEKYFEAEDLRSFCDEWERYLKALEVHMDMEDNAMFVLLDEVGDGAITQAGLAEEHVEDQRLASAVDTQLKNENWSALRPAWLVWKTHHLNHLEHEEKIMMPLVPQTAETPAAIARVVHDHLLKPSENLTNFDWYIGWVVQLLSEHGSTEQPPNVATRVFASALQYDCTPDEWERLRPVVKRNCTRDIWTEMVSEFGLNDEGKIVL